MPETRVKNVFFLTALPNKTSSFLPRFLMALAVAG
jgi:hypothetical protein